MIELWKKLEPHMIGLLRQLVELHRTTKLTLILLMDASLCVAAVWIAFSLRLGFWDLWGPAEAIVIFVSLAVWLPIFLMMGVYRSVMPVSYTHLTLPTKRIV